MRKAYKVIYYDNTTDEMLSCVMRTVKYIKDEFVYSPNIGRLCVFDTYHHAICFCGYNEEVWECEIGKVYPNSRIPNYNMPFIHLFGKRSPSNDENQGYFKNLDSYMLMLAKIIKSKKKFSHLLYKNSEFPPGTIFTDKVKLIKKAYPRSY
jgi:hypothetical protein